MECSHRCSMGRSLVSKLALVPIRGELGINYDAAFLYLSNRGAIAERWAHEPGFGRHAIGVDSLHLTNTTASRVADVNLKNALFVVTGNDFDWGDFSAASAEFLGDCLKMLQPGGVSRVYCDIKLSLPADSFESARDRVVDQLLRGQCNILLDDTAVFEDVLVALTFRMDDIHVHTSMGPMRRLELSPQLDPSADLDDYPEQFLFVQRRYEIAAGRGLPEDRWNHQEAIERLQSFVGDGFATAPKDVCTYVASILHMEEGATSWP